jgi:hypothetical protein
VDDVPVVQQQQRDEACTNMCKLPVVILICMMRMDVAHHGSQDKCSAAHAQQTRYDVCEHLPMSTQKSPRIVPGAEFAGLVSPSIFLPVATTPDPARVDPHNHHGSKLVGQHVLRQVSHHSW